MPFRPHKFDDGLDPANGLDVRRVRPAPGKDAINPCQQRIEPLLEKRIAPISQDRHPIPVAFAAPHNQGMPVHIRMEHADAFDMPPLPLAFAQIRASNGNLKAKTKSIPAWPRFSIGSDFY